MTEAASKYINKEAINSFLNKYALYFILLFMIIVMSVLKPDNFPKFNNFTNIMRQMTPIGVMALGVTFCIIIGGTDLSGGSVIAFCSVVAAHLAHPGLNGGSQFPLLIPILGAVLAGGLMGLINGVVVSYGNVPPFIATLGMMSVARGAAMLISGGRPIGDFNSTFKFIGGGMVRILPGIKAIPMPVIVFILAAVIAYILLHRSKFGTYVYAIGGNEHAARVSGISVDKIKCFVYILAGMFYGIGAIILTSRQESGNPASGLSYDMEAITCAIIGGSSFSGGIGKISGTFLGALFMGILANAMTMMQVNPNWQMIVKGSVIIGAVLFDMMKNRKRT
ncbi:MAG: ABC transporter permease [Clostridiales bacterium]|jgi:ribose/xylose/arabinose/galactoside ABC-type transport system permease subunit|nr:ABC transporter permease [Clostridiales bacterium]